MVQFLQVGRSVFTRYWMVTGWLLGGMPATNVTDLLKTKATSMLLSQSGV